MTNMFIWYCPRCHVNLGAKDLELQKRSNETWKELPGDSKLNHIRLHSSGGVRDELSHCWNCNLGYLATSNSFSFKFENLLSGISWRKFIKWSLAQNAGLVSYELLSEASLSDENNPGSRLFSHYVLAHRASGKVVLDIGCGPLTWPSYFPPDWRNSSSIGADPFPTSFGGSVVKGTGEFLPIGEGVIDNVLAATSLDHTMDLMRTLQETFRVLRVGGRLIIWDHAGSTRLRDRKSLKEIATKIIETIRDGRKTMCEFIFNDFRRVRVYENLVVVPIHRGFADPFHLRESQRHSWGRLLNRSLNNAGFRKIDEDISLGFSCWEKT
jgi:SAM-dependent methyltransferase